MLARLRRLGPYIRRYRARYAIGAVCVIVSVALRFSVPYLLGDSIDTIRAAADAGAGGAGTEGAGAEGAGAADTGTDYRGLILFAAVGMVLAAGVGALIRTTSRLMILGNSRRASHDVRADVFDRLLRLAPSFYVRHRTGHIMSRAVNDMQNVQGLLGPVFMYLIETGVLFVVGLAFMLSADPWLTVVGLAPFPFFLYAARRLARRVQEGSREAQERLGDVSAKVDESLSGHRVIRTLALEDFDRQRFVEQCEGYSSVQLSVARTRATLAAWMAFLAALSTFLVLIFGAPRVEAGHVTVGDIVALALYLGMLATPTRTLGFVLSSLQRGAAALERIGEVLDMPATIRDDAADQRHEVHSGALSVRGLTIEFAPAHSLPHLSGSLPGSDPSGVESAGGAAGTPDRSGGARRVLDDVTFEVPAGATIGVVGPVGSGKTTLLRALARQVEVEPGQVLVDGQDLTELSFEELRRAVNMAPQDAFLFSETLLDNVRFGAPDASRQDVESALEVAQLDKDLDQLPDGVDTMLGERGVNLSGGQRQRASLARVALLRPAVLLLDDTMSAVDTHTADEILRRLRPLMRDRTTIVVAHRLSTVRDADQILVLDEGRITERGTHAELLALGGYYAEVWSQQATQEGLSRELGIGSDAGDDREVTP